MIFERTVSKQQSDNDKSFAVIKEGFDFFFFNGGFLCKGVFKYFYEQTGINSQGIAEISNKVQEG